MRPITNGPVQHSERPSKVQECVRRAFRVALTEPQGPTHIEAASEVLLEQTAVRADRAGGLPQHPIAGMRERTARRGRTR